MFDTPPALPKPSTAERRDMHPTDQQLRKFGFVIYSRRFQKEPVWRLGDDLYSQSDALAFVVSQIQSVATV